MVIIALNLNRDIKVLEYLVFYFNFLSLKYLMLYFFTGRLKFLHLNLFKNLNINKWVFSFNLNLMPPWFSNEQHFFSLNCDEQFVASFLHPKLDKLITNLRTTNERVVSFNKYCTYSQSFHHRGSDEFCYLKGVNFVLIEIKTVSLY